MITQKPFPLFGVENEITSNKTKKSRFIEFLQTFLRLHKINVLISRDDCDTKMWR